MKKITKKRIIVAAVIIFALAAAWFYGGDKPGEAEGQGKTPFLETGITRAGEESFPDGHGVFGEGDPEGIPVENKDTANKVIASKDAGSTATEPGNAINRIAEGKAAEEGLAAAGKDGANIKNSEGESSVSTPLANKTLDSAAPGGTGPQPGGPAEQQGPTINPGAALTCNFSVTCKAIFSNMNRFNPDKLEVLPADGVICPPEDVVFYEGESVFNVLQRELKKSKIHLEFTTTPLYNTYYIEGINNIYEFDCGELSGWIYKVNGCSPSCGCNCYRLQDSDVVELLYSCDLGRDFAQEEPGGNS